MISIWGGLTTKARKVSAPLSAGSAVHHLKRRGFSFSALVLVTVLAGSVSAHAEKPDSYKLQNMKYEVYAGGVNVVKSKMIVDLTPAAQYRMFFSAETQGFLEMLAPWVGTFESKGWVLNGGNLFRPRIHESIAMWRGEKEVKTYSYTQDGGFVKLSTMYKGKKEKTEDPEPELTNGTTDVLAATMMVMQEITKGGKCEGSSEVYDGSRRYALVFKHARTVNLEATRYNIFSGPAVECTVEVNPIAGRWHEKPRGWMSIQEQGRKLGTMPTVWFAQLRENAMVVPVRVRVKTEYGTLFMHMTEYESGDTVAKLPD